MSAEDNVNSFPNMSLYGINNFPPTSISGQPNNNINSAAMTLYGAGNVPTNSISTQLHSNISAGVGQGSSGVMTLYGTSNAPSNNISTQLNSNVVQGSPEVMTLYRTTQVPSSTINAQLHSNMNAEVGQGSALMVVYGGTSVPSNFINTQLHSNMSTGVNQDTSGAMVLGGSDNISAQLQNNIISTEVEQGTSGVMTYRVDNASINSSIGQLQNNVNTEVEQGASGFMAYRVDNASINSSIGQLQNNVNTEVQQGASRFMAYRVDNASLNSSIGQLQSNIISTEVEQVTSGVMAYRADNTSVNSSIAHRHSNISTEVQQGTSGVIACSVDNASINTSIGQLQSNISTEAEQGTSGMMAYRADNPSINSNIFCLQNNISTEVGQFSSGVMTCRADNTSSNNFTQQRSNSIAEGNQGSAEAMALCGTDNTLSNIVNTQPNSNIRAQQGQGSSGDNSPHNSVNMLLPKEENNPKDATENIRLKLDDVKLEDCSVTQMNSPECNANMTAVQKYDIQNKLRSGNYKSCLVSEMLPKHVNVKYVQTNGLHPAMFFKNIEKIGGRILPKLMKNKTDLIEKFLGSEEILNIMDHDREEIMEMTMKEWTTYYHSSEKQKKLSVVELEISDTPLDRYIVAPDLVRQLDWIDHVWPFFLKDRQSKDGSLTYPKVQKLCHMSAEGCFTDFHILMGGAACWLAVAEGSLAIWLVRASPSNLDAYKKWVPSRTESNEFFGDKVKECQRIVLDPGMAVIIPEGWIFALYSMKDTVAFEGYFLHSYGVPMHIRIAKMEESFEVPDMMRFPLFTDLLWYALERYSHCVLGTSFLKLPPKSSKYIKSMEVLTKRKYLCNSEIWGIKYIVSYLNSSPTHKRIPPTCIANLLGILESVEFLVKRHEHDDQDKAITGKIIPRWSNDDEVKKPPAPLIGSPLPQVKRFNMKKRPPGVKKRKRVRCHKCETCLGDDCKVCMFCRDMVRYGGEAKLRQSCINRQCMRPSLSLQAVCSVCNPDGPQKYGAEPKQPKSRDDLRECTDCYDIVHKKCAVKKFGNSNGKINEALQNSWLCPGCCKKQGVFQNDSTADEDEPKASTSHVEN